MSYIGIIDRLERIQEHLLAISGIEASLSISSIGDVLDDDRNSLTREYISHALGYEAEQIKIVITALESEHKKSR